MEETKYSMVISNPAMSEFKHLLCTVDGREPKLIERADTLSLSAGEPCDVRLRFVSGRYTSEEIVMPLTEWNLTYRLEHRYRKQFRISYFILLLIMVTSSSFLPRNPWQWLVLVPYALLIALHLLHRKNTIMLKVE